MVCEQTIRDEAVKAIAQAGSMRKYAKKVGLSVSALSMCLSKQMPLPKRLLDALEYERVTKTEFRKKEAKQAEGTTTEGEIHA